MDAPPDRPEPSTANGLEVTRYLISVLVAALMIGILAMPGAMPWVAAAVLPMSLGYALVVAFPVALVVRARCRMTLLVAVLTGATVGAFPVGLVALFSSGILGWLFLAAVGGAAGLVAWLALRLQELPGVLLRGRRPVLASLGGSAATVGLAIAGAASALSLIYGPNDKTCHNPLRDGRRSVTPVANASLDIPDSEWLRLRWLLAEAGGAGGWSVRDLSRSGDGFRRVSVSLCHEPGMNLSADQLIFSGRPPAIPGVAIWVYQPQGGSSWVVPARVVYRQVSMTWPGKLSFKDSSGRHVGAPEWYCAPQNGLPPDPVLCPAGRSHAVASSPTSTAP